MALKTKKKKKRGRPRKEIDLELVEKLGRLHCTDEELAYLLGVSVDTLERRRAEDPRITEAQKKGQAEMKCSLRRWQVIAAEKGNIVMQIWLGKQLLGQKDRQEITGEAPIKVTYHAEFAPDGAVVTADAPPKTTGVH